MKRFGVSLLWGFSVSLSIAIAILLFFPEVQDLYLKTGWPVVLILRVALPYGLRTLGYFQPCEPAGSILAAVLTWSIFFSGVILCGRIRKRPESDGSHESSRGSRILFLALIGIIMIPVLLNALILWGLHDRPFHGRALDRGIWDEALKDDSNHMSSPRCEMAKELQGRLVREKSTRAEVVALLGEPEDMSKADKQRLHFLSYTLGMCSGFRVDYDSLDIHFDENDRVKRVCIVQH
jgi:hypothetical protein